MAVNPVSTMYFVSPPKISTYRSSAPKMYIQMLDSFATPLSPCITEIVYTTQTNSRIPIVIHFVALSPSIVVTVWASSGVDTEKVVAVPAISANTASTSTRRPGTLSVHFPRTGRQASEYFCFRTPRTWSIKPKQAASTA